MGGDGVVHAVFLGEEAFAVVPRAPPGVLDGFGDRPHVSAGAEGFLAVAAEDDHAHVVVLGPVIELLLDGPDHGQGQGVELAGLVEGDEPERALLARLLFKEDGVLGLVLRCVGAHGHSPYCVGRRSEVSHPTGIGPGHQSRWVRGCGQPL